MVKIKVDIGKETYSCSRVHPNDLKEGELITLDNKFIYEIKAISVDELNYNVALSGYGTIKCNSNNFLTKINGGWYINPA